MLPIHHLIRAALQLQAIYRVRYAGAAGELLQERLGSYDEAQERCRQALRQAAMGGQPAAMLAVRRHLRSMVRAVEQAAVQIVPQLPHLLPPVPDLRSLLAELRQLDQEFGGLRLDLRAKTLGVSTEPIELQSVYLGSFTIQLGWKRLEHAIDDQTFTVVAEEPHPAPNNDAVTHPHVKHDVLCLGIAAPPLELALEQGRLFDAFCLVRSVLSTYNPKSPHVPLEEWDGVECRDCGSRTSASDTSKCACCGREFCNDCIGKCQDCESARCYECLSRCSGCDEHFCSGCLTAIAASGKACCEQCVRTCSRCEAAVACNDFDGASQLCPACAEAAPKEPPLPTDQPSTTQPPPSPENDHEPSEAVSAVA